MAAKDTPSMAKNKIRRSLQAIIDPHPTPTEIKDLWVYFDSICAYCGVSISRESRTGHIDHVVSSALGGSNSIYNHVLSCARCNGDEKREESWESFLERKVSNPVLLKTRQDKISAWLARKPINQLQTQFQLKVESIIKSTIDNFDSAVSELRNMRKK